MGVSGCGKRWVLVHAAEQWRAQRTSPAWCLPVLHAGRCTEPATALLPLSLLCSTVGALLAEALGCPFYEGDEFHPPANVAKMQVVPAQGGAALRGLAWLADGYGKEHKIQAALSCRDQDPLPQPPCLQAGAPLTDADRWPWLERLADVVQRHLADGRPAVLSCSALKPEYRALLRCGRGDGVAFVSAARASLRVPSVLFVGSLAFHSIKPLSAWDH